MRNYENHIMLLEAINEVRAELNSHAEKEGFNVEGSKILLRLANLYALVDVVDIKRAMVEMKRIDERRIERMPRYKKAA